MENKRNKMSDKWPDLAVICTEDFGHLLTVLASEKVIMRVDSTRDEPYFVLYTQRKNVSVSRGSFPFSALKSLVSAGCGTWKPGDKEVKITPEGRANLRRRAALKIGTAALGVSDFSAQHKQLILEEKSEPEAPGKDPESLRFRDANESPLAWLARRKNKAGLALISAVQYQAGERLRTDLTISAMLPRVTANWGAVGGGQGGASMSNPSDIALAARQRVHNALTAVGPDLNGILIDLCGFLKGLEQIEVERGWPARSGKVVLGLALNSLAQHYGLKEYASGKVRSPIRRWPVDDPKSPVC